MYFQTSEETAEAGAKMNAVDLVAFLSEKGFAVKEVPLINTLEKLGKDDVNTFDLTSTFADKVKVNTFNLSTKFSDKLMGSKFYTCPGCPKMFDNRMALCNHMKFEHYNLSIADTKYSDKTISYFPVKQEETSYIIVRTYPDDDSDVRKRSIRRVETRPRKPYDKKLPEGQIVIDGPFQCNACNENFGDCCNYSLHVNSVHFKRRRLILRCQICEKRFGGKNVDEEPQGSQERATPLENGRLGCEICGKVFSLPTHLEYHHKKYHSKIKPYECSLCSKSFTQVTGLSQHMKTHSGIKPFVCTVCAKAFRQKAGLEQHMRIHSKIKPFNCLLCNRAFTQSAHLSQHMRIHTKIEPFECTLCSRRFKQSSHLNFHLRSHESGNDSMLYDSGITITPLLDQS